MTITLHVRNFTGKVIFVEVVPDGKVSDAKVAIARVMAKEALPRLAYKGHELRDHHSLSYYCDPSKDVLHILPPLKTPKILLQFERRDGSRFAMDVDPGTTIAQLKKEVLIEEKIDAHKLRFIGATDDPDDPESLIVSEPRDLPDEMLVSQFPLSEATIFLCGLPPPVSPPRMFHVCVRVSDGNDAVNLDVETAFAHTLRGLRETVELQHQVSVVDHVLVFVGKELVGEDLPIWDLGIIPDCTIHAVPFLFVNVEVRWKKEPETMLLHPLTQLSTIRKKLERTLPADAGISLARYWFTLDYRERLKDWRNLWDLDMKSGSSLYMHTSVISLTIQSKGRIEAVDVEENETVVGLKERWALTVGGDAEVFSQTMAYRGKLLNDEKTLKEEGLVGGETLHFVRSLAAHRVNPYAFI